MLDIVKDFALVNRYEYVPYCPICGIFFKSSSDIMILDCRHFFCKACIIYLLQNEQLICPFDQRKTAQPMQGDALGDSVEFLNDWMSYIQGADQERKEETIDRLMADIVMIRKHLNYNDVPCRVTTTNVRCVENFGCLSEHTLKFFQKQGCPKPGCSNANCMFIHKANNEPPRPRQQNPPAPQKVQNNPGGKGNKSATCCSLI